MNTKVYVIKDSDIPTEFICGYLCYYKKTRTFVIEVEDTHYDYYLPPIIQDMFERGHVTIDPYWSRRWVQQRIIPPDRQNIGAILRDNGLKYYDEFSLLKLATGRCAQDECYIEPVKDSEIPLWLKDRWKHKVVDFMLLSDSELLVFFGDESSRLISINDLVFTHHDAKRYVTAPNKFANARLLPEGFGIRWIDYASVMYSDLYHLGKPMPIKLKSIEDYVCNNLIDSNGAENMIQCSRQYISELEKNNKLARAKTNTRTHLYWKRDVLQFVE